MPEHFDLFNEMRRTEGDAFISRAYRTISVALSSSGVDALLLETMNSWEEAELALEQCKYTGLPLLVSFAGACRDATTLKPHPEVAPYLAEKVIDAKLNGLPIEVLGFNCAEPELILQCLKCIEETPKLSSRLHESGIRLACYANGNDSEETLSTEGYDVGRYVFNRREDLQGDKYAHVAAEFIKHGCTLIGGCCGTGINETTHLKTHLNVTPAHLGA